MRFEINYSNVYYPHTGLSNENVSKGDGVCLYRYCLFMRIHIAIGDDNSHGR